MRLAEIETFEQLLPWLAKHLQWPIDEIDHETETLLDDMVYDYQAEELGLKPEHIAHVREIRQLHPLVSEQSWGIFFINFEDKKIPIGVLKRILGGLTLKKRQDPDQKVWHVKDLLFISTYGQSGDRALSFLYFTQENDSKKIILKELGLGQQDTDSKLEHVEDTLKKNLRWPEKPSDWDKWEEAFTSSSGYVIETAKILTSRLAELANSIRTSVGEVMAYEHENGPLTKIYRSFKEVIFHHLEPDDFADMYAQMICYGLLAARIQRSSGGLVADDVTLIIPDSQPFLKKLLETFLAVGGRKTDIDFNELGVDEVIETLQKADMEEIVRDFGNKTPHGDPILYFYEYFLRDYDSDKRASRGVYYTPPSLVKFIVRSVDEILIKEFGLEDGLADLTTWGDMLKKHPKMTLPKYAREDMPFVQILDPAAGTGKFLIEVIDLIEKKLKKKWGKAGKNEREIRELWNEYVPSHLLPRLNGFELMMAPYVIAHIMISKKLSETGYSPKENAPRFQVYLTNTLEEAIGYGKQQEIPLESLKLEVKGANRIKVETPITVIVGNPPYSVSSMNLSKYKKGKGKRTFIGELIQPYFHLGGKSLESHGEKNTSNLNDDYVKFIRFAEWRITKTGAGTLGFITNHGWIDNITFHGMRESLLQAFDELYVLDLHGNAKKKERAPDESKDENVFKIKQGTAISLFIKHSEKENTLANVLYFDVWGISKKKYDWLKKEDISTTEWQKLEPKYPEYFCRPFSDTFAVEYKKWWKINDIFDVCACGINTRKDKLTIQWTKENVRDTIEKLASLSEEEVRAYFKLGPDTGAWKVPLAQKDLLEHDKKDEYTVPILYRPFDIRYTWYSGKSNGFINEPRRNVMGHMLAGKNIGLITERQQSQRNILWSITSVSQNIIDRRSLLDAYLFPLYSYDDSTVVKGRRIVNVKKDFLEALSQRIDFQFVETATGQKNTFSPEDVFYYIYAVLHSLNYRKRYEEFLRTDFPRIPTPGSTELFRNLVERGRELVALHLFDVSHADVLKQPLIRYIGRGEARVGKKYPKYENGKVMINAYCHFEDVTEDIWNFHIGYYQVCERWLKDRAGKGGKYPKPGRILTEDDILHYRRMTTAIRETIDLMSDIDRVIYDHGGWPAAFINNGEFVDVESDGTKFKGVSTEKSK